MSMKPTLEQEVASLHTEIEQLRDQMSDECRYRDERIAQLHAERDRYRKALLNVNSEHPASHSRLLHGFWCRTCFKIWPCPTVRKVRAALDGDR